MNSLNCLIKRLTIWITFIILIIIILYIFELLNDLRKIKKKKKIIKPITKNLNNNNNNNKNQIDFKKITFIAAGNLSNVSGMYVETYKKRNLSKSKTFYSPIEGVQTNTLTIEPCEILKIIILLKPNGVLTKFIEYKLFKDQQIIKIEHENRQIVIDKNQINPLGKDYCAWYDPYCCIIDGACSGVIGQSAGCAVIDTEWVALCEAAGGGPEDPLADACAAMAVPVALACSSAVSTSIGFQLSDCKKAAGC